MQQPDKKIITRDGREYYGYGFGADREAILELVFNTSMTGYQDPEKNVQTARRED